MHNATQDAPMAATLATPATLLSAAIRPLSDDCRVVVDAANAAWNDALNRGDVDALATLDAADATLSPADGNVVSGLAEIRRLFQGFIDAGVHNHQLETLTAFGDDRRIVQVARWSARAGRGDGSMPTLGGITTNVLERDADGRWRSGVQVWNTTP
jgi:uncharacterized protein (TIGR02246 family)